MSESLSFWEEVERQNRDRVLSWISELLDYILMIMWLVIALVVFQFLQAKFPSDTMSLLVQMDHMTIDIVFGCFCLSTIRKAALGVVAGRS